MTVTLIIFTYLVTILFLWLDYSDDKSGLNDKKQEKDANKVKRKKYNNLWRSVLLALILGLTLYITKKEKQTAQDEYNERLKVYQTIHNIDSAGRIINNLVTKIKISSEELSDTLNSIGNNVKNQFSETQNNLNNINKSTNDNFKHTATNLSDIAYQSKRLQYPIPGQIQTQFTFKWLIEGVDKSFKDEIKRLNKKYIDYEWGVHENYKIDSDFGQYPLLCLSHKNLLLIIEKDNQKLIYKTILYPEKIKQTVSEFYFPYERNTYRNFTITYNDRHKTITLEGKECPFYLQSSTKLTTSLLDLDGAKITLLVNSEDGLLTHHLNADNRVEYIFGYEGYEANDGTKLIGYEILNFNISMLNGKYSFSSIDTTISRLKFSLGKFEIDTD